MEFIGGAAPRIKLDPDDAVVARGREAWTRRKKDARACSDDWKAIGEALLVGRHEAMAKAHKSKPVGKTYNQFFHNWLQIHAFDELDKSDRDKLLLIMLNLEGVEKWRTRLSEGQRACWNHPSTVWRIFNCRDRGWRAMKPATASEGPAQKQRGAAASTLQTMADQLDEEREQIDWHRNLIVRARKAIGDADLDGLWALPEPPDAGLVAVVRKAADAWSQLADYLQSIRDATPEELAKARASYAETRQDLAEARQRKVARKQEQEHAT